MFPIVVLCTPIINLKIKWKLIKLHMLYIIYRMTCIIPQKYIRKFMIIHDELYASLTKIKNVLILVTPFPSNGVKNWLVQLYKCTDHDK